MIYGLLSSQHSAFRRLIVDPVLMPTWWDMVKKSRDVQVQDQIIGFRNWRIVFQGTPQVATMFKEQYCEHLKVNPIHIQLWMSDKYLASAVILH